MEADSITCPSVEEHIADRWCSHHWMDGEIPEGGQTYGKGFAIAWQRGPLGRGIDRKPANGAFVEDIIAAALDRLEFYQRSKFDCVENGAAVDYLRGALAILNRRTERREIQKVEGTDQGN